MLLKKFKLFAVIGLVILPILLLSSCTASDANGLGNMYVQNDCGH
jgi:hypothetical protein